jgi:hypothetical protein
MSDLVGVQEVRREGGGTEPAGEYIFSYLYYLHIENSFLKLCHVFSKHPAYFFQR